MGLANRTFPAGQKILKQPLFSLLNVERIFTNPKSVMSLTGAQSEMFCTVKGIKVLCSELGI